MPLLHSALFILLAVYAGLMTGGYIEERYKNRQKKSRPGTAIPKAASKITLSKEYTKERRMSNGR